MASTSPGIIALNGLEFVIQDETYQKQLQTPFTPRFSTGDPSLGDLSFFQYIAMEDWSGGVGQDVFKVNNQFSDCEGVDVTVPGEIKLAPKVLALATINGPLTEHLNRPVEDEDAWPQVIEWLGKAVFYNDRIEFDASGVEFLEVFETDIIQDRVINRDASGTVGIITNDTHAEITSISKVQGLPGDTFLVSVKFHNVAISLVNGYPTPGVPFPRTLSPTTLSFRLDFGGDAEEQSDVFSVVEREFSDALFTIGARYTPPPVYFAAFVFFPAVLAIDVVIDFTIRVPNKNPGVYKIWTSCRAKGSPFTYAYNQAFADVINPYFADGAANANVLFYLQSIDSILVERKNLYAPQLKAAATIGSKLIGGRSVGGVGFVEVYELQNGAVDRTLQISLVDAGITPTDPLYMQFIGSNDILIAAFNNRIYKIDVKTANLTAAQRITFIGEVPGDYVSGMALWNQRVYIGSFSKNQFTSTITWTDGIEIQGSYAIDGKFWITDMANFQGGLFYAGGTQDKNGEVRAFPSTKITEVEHPVFDARVRSLNAGRKLYFGMSHAVGVGTITEKGPAPWARIDLGDESTNIVWDIEEVGDTVFFLADNGVFKTTAQFTSNGFLSTSKLGANTPLIDKIWTSVTIETEPLLGGNKVRVLARSAARPDDQWFLLGEITVSDGSKKEFSIPANFTSQWLQVRLELSTTDENTSPVVKKLLVKYVPASLQKLQWVFTIRATDHLKLLDKNREQRRGSDIVNDIWDLTEAGVISFRDKDEQTFNVIVTDMRESSPLINKKQQESLVSVELLEV